MSVGGLAIVPSREKHVSAQLAEIRGAYGITSQVQWKTAKTRRDNIYRAYIDVLHSLVESGQAHFHVRLTPVKNRKFTNDVVSKSFYQLLLHRAGRYYADHMAIHARPDNGCCTEYLPKMLPGINSDIAGKFECKHAAVRTIQPCDSGNEHILQLVDVSLGALTSARNGNHLNGGVGDFKRSLIEYALDKFGVRDITASSPITARKFNLWNVTPAN